MGADELPHEMHPEAYERTASIAHGTIAGWCYGKGEIPPLLTEVLKQAYEHAFAVAFNDGYYAAAICAQCGQAKARHGGTKNLGPCPDMPQFRWRPIGGWANDSGKTVGSPDQCAYCGARKADGVRLVKARVGGIAQYVCRTVVGCRKRRARAQTEAVAHVS
jgi:hypothetical protein